MNTTIKLIIIFLVIGLLFAGMIYGIAYFGSGDMKKYGENMSAEVAIPTVDLAVPTRVEVATFALG